VLKITSTYPKATQVLEEYRRWVVGQSKANLAKGGNRGALYGSVRGYVRKKFNRSALGRFTGGTALPSLEFTYNAYGDFLDKGVQGSEATKNMETPYRFRNNKYRVPVKAIRSWVKKRGMQKGAEYAISRSIYKKGIEARKWFTKPFESRFSSYMRRYHVAVADDIQLNIANQLAKNLKNRK
jgi:hypothetical protein